MAVRTAVETEKERTETLRQLVREFNKLTDAIQDFEIPASQDDSSSEMMYLLAELRKWKRAIE